MFLPSKLVDYLGSGIPIVAVTPSEGATARVVRECGGIVLSIEDPAALDRLLLQIVEEGAVPASPRPAAVEEYEFRNVGRGLLDRLDRFA